MHHLPFDIKALRLSKIHLHGHGRANDTFTLPKINGLCYFSTLTTKVWENMKCGCMSKVGHLPMHEENKINDPHWLLALIAKVWVSARCEHVEVVGPKAQITLRWINNAHFISGLTTFLWDNMRCFHVYLTRKTFSGNFWQPVVGPDDLDYVVGPV